MRCVLVFTAFVLSVKAVPTRSAQAYPSVVPEPTSISRGYNTTADFLLLSRNVDVVCVDHSPCPASINEVLYRGVDRLLRNLKRGVNPMVTLPYLRVRLAPIKNTSNPALSFPPKKVSMGEGIAHLRIELTTIQSPVDAAALGKLSEAYTLKISDRETTLRATSFVGALRGLETFGQLVVYDGVRYVVPNLPIAVTDSPRFRHRGILLDTARHFFPVSDILRILDGMAMAKLNVLHWHIVDSQTFPFESKKFPDLAKYGALAPSLVYSQTAIAEIVEYALDRGVRIIPEFDLPGHTASWGFAPSLQWATTPCWKQVASRPVLERAINVVSLDVTRTNVLSFVNDLLDEVMNVFPDPYLHLGGDEVIHKCWEEIPAIQAFKTTHRISNLQEWFTKKVLEHVNGRKTVILWEEAYESGSMDQTPASVVNVWKNISIMHEASRTHPILLSYGAYLDRTAPVDGQPTPWMYVSTWTDMYLFAYPHTLPASVMGGEMSSWDENADRTNIDTRLFQRGNAVAERLWSSPDVNDTVSARARFGEFRCKQNRRLGTTIGPIFPDYCDVHLTTAQSPPPAHAAPASSLAWIITASFFMIVSTVLSFCMYCKSNPQTSILKPEDYENEESSSLIPGANYLALHNSSLPSLSRRFLEEGDSV
jgi:hexosaminidase